jgi:glucose/arabinose dehydrogenase/chitodextrinase
MGRRARGGTRRGVVAALVAGLVMPIAVIATAMPAAALALPAGFSLVTIPTGLTDDLTNMAFLPDGTDTMLVLGKCGQVRRVTQAGTSVGVSFNPLNAVNCEADRGLVGIELAPDFATTRQVWLSYNYNASGTAWGRVSRLTADSATAPTALTGETVVLDQIPSFSSTGATCDNSHTVGTVLFAPDGTVFVGDGDASSYCNVDNSALGAQDLTTPRGKILHINRDGSGVSSNPFFDATAPTSWKSRVFALGFRNPFRFAVKPGTTSTLYVGDVGWNTYEEVDIANGGENFGWPCWEGPPTFRNGYDALSQCQALYANPPANLKAPLYFWNHFNAAGDAAIGGVLYQGTTYPADYQGAYFFADYAAGRIWTMRTNGSDTIVRAPEANGFGTAVGAPVGFRAGPNGDVFYADIASASVKRLRYAAGNRAPVASPVADRVAGSAPLTVAFDGSGSFDLDDEPITYAWNFGDGGTSSAAKPTHTFTGSATYTVRLTVTDQLGATGTATLTVSTQNNPPVLTVTGPPGGAVFAVGAQVSVTASATDPEDGVLPRSSITFQQIQHHCPTPGNCHLHPGATTTAPASGPYVTVMPDHGDDSFLEIVVRARDSGGTLATKSVTIATEEHNLAVSSTPAGVSVVVNGTNSVANPILKEVAGSQNRLIAPATSGNLVFLRWADGVTTADRTITMPSADLALVAQYDTRPTAVAAASPASGPAPLAVQLSAAGSSDPDAGDSIVSYAWNFGDGTTGAGASVAHTYGANGTYVATLTVTDSRGASATATATVTVGATGTAIPAPSASTWQVNTRAALSGASLVLTPNVGGAAGTAFFRTPVPSAGLTVSFDATIDQGTGADGMTLALADAATTALTAVGAPGAGLGFAGIRGVAVALDTWQGAGEPSSNFIGISPSSASGVLTYSATTTNVPALRNATHHIDVAVAGGRVTVKVDGTQRLDAAVAVPTNVLVGFSAATGGATDRHTVTNFVGRYGGTAPPPPPPPPPTAQLTVTPTALAYGTVAAGATSAKTLSIANTGGAALTVSSVGAPAAPFTMTGAPAAGASLAPGQSVTVTVTLRPTQAGTWSSSIPIATSAGSAAVALSGTTPPPGGGTAIPAPWSGGWQLNGVASLNGASLVVTPNIANAGGNAFWPTALPTANLRASFDLTIDQGSGADGATFILGDPAAGARPTSVGGSAGSLGAAGIPGVAVTFDTFKNGTDVSANFIGVAKTGTGLAYNTTSTNIPTLRGSTHHVDIAVSSGHLTVAVDGVPKLDSTLALPASALLGFTAATGGLTDRHTITNAILSV